MKPLFFTALALAACFVTTADAKAAVPPPRVFSVVPSEGSVLGGQHLHINGIQFAVNFHAGGNKARAPPPPPRLRFA